MPRQIKWIPKDEIARRWESFVSQREAIAERKHLGNGLLSEAVSFYLDATSVPGSGVQDSKDVPPAGHNPATSPASDILAGLKPDDAQAVREFAEILRGEDEWLRNMAMMAIESSRRLKAPQVQERAVADAPPARKVRSRG